MPVGAREPGDDARDDHGARLPELEPVQGEEASEEDSELVRGALRLRGEARPALQLVALEEP